MSSRRSFLISFSIFCSLLAPFAARAQWPANGVAVCTATGPQQNLDMVSDGAGGIIVVWEDARNGGPNSDIYAQRISSTGTVLWSTNGVSICSAASSQFVPKVATDNSGGAIIVWHDNRNGVDTNIFAQRVNSAGVVQWPADGVMVCGATGTQVFPVICTNGAGGAIIAWQDYRAGVAPAAIDIFAQSVSSGGSTQWAANGIPVCTAPNMQQALQLAPVSGGAAVLFWHDSRFNLGSSPQYVLAQRIGSGGTADWAPDGVPVAFAPSNQYAGSIASDGAGGWIVPVSDGDAYAQRIGSVGALVWTARGIVLTTTTDSELSMSAVSDGAGGAIATWERSHYDIINDVFQYSIYTQHLNSLGVIQWTAGGVPLCTAANQQGDPGPKSVTDGAGGAITIWQDSRSGTNSKIYAQRVNGSGVVQWTVNGVAVCNATGDQTSPIAVSDGAGGALVAWIDTRNGVADIYAVRVGSNGQIPTAVSNPVPSAAFILGDVRPNPSSSIASVDVQLPKASDVKIEVVDVAGRRVSEVTLKDVGAGTHTVEVDIRNNNGRPLPNGVYFCHVTTRTESATRKFVILH